MLEPESGDKGWTTAVSSWDRRGKLKLSCGGLSLSGSLSWQTDATAFDCSKSLFIGERKAVKESLGGAMSWSLARVLLFIGTFLNKSVISGWESSASEFLSSERRLRTCYSWDWESVCTTLSARQVAGCGSLCREQADCDSLSELAWKLLIEELTSDLLSSRFKILRRKFLFSCSN